MVQLTVAKRQLESVKIVVVVATAAAEPVCQVVRWHLQTKLVSAESRMERKLRIGPEPSWLRSVATLVEVKQTKCNIDYLYLEACQSLSRQAVGNTVWSTLIRIANSKQSSGVSHYAYLSFQLAFRTKG